MLKPNTKTIVLIGVLSALSFGLMIFPHFPIIPAYSFLDVDFSDVPALLGAVAVHPVAGLLIVLIKNILHLPISSTGFVGELSNFICGATLVLSTGLFTRCLMKNTPYKKKLLFVLPVASLFQLVAAILGNYFLMIPLFNIQAMAKAYILGGVIPFNLIKDALVCVVFYFVYTLVYPKIQKRLY